MVWCGARYTSWKGRADGVHTAYGVRSTEYGARSTYVVGGCCVWLLWLTPLARHKKARVTALEIPTPPREPSPYPKQPA